MRNLAALLLLLSCTPTEAHNAYSYDYTINSTRPSNSRIRLWYRVGNWSGGSKALEAKPEISFREVDVSKALNPWYERRRQQIEYVSLHAVENIMDTEASQWKDLRKGTGLFFVCLGCWFLVVLGRKAGSP